MAEKGDQTTTKLAWDQQRQWEVTYQEKNEAIRQGVKGLALMNGGAAVALGAFLQAIIGKPEAATLVPFVLWGIALTVLGVASASIIFWIGYRQSLYQERHQKFREDNPWWRAYWILAGVSVALFVVGLMCVVVGAAINLTA